MSAKTKIIIIQCNVFIMSIISQVRTDDREIDLWLRSVTGWIIQQEYGAHTDTNILTRSRDSKECSNLDCS